MSAGTPRREEDPIVDSGVNVDMSIVIQQTTKTHKHRQSRRHCTQSSTTTTTTTTTTTARKAQMSVEDATTHLITNIRSTLAKLTQMWDQVHMSQHSREARIEFAYEHFHTLLRDIVASEEEMIRGVAEDIEARRAAVVELRRIFNMPNFDESPYPAGSITLLKALDKDMSTLSDQREALLKEQAKLYAEAIRLAKRTDSGEEQEELENNEEYKEVDERILGEHELKALRGRIEKLSSLLYGRLERVDELQIESKKIRETLASNCSLGEDELELLNFDSHASQAVISEELVTRCSALNQKLKDEYDSWLEQVAFRYDELLVKMEELSKKCFRADFAPEQLHQLDFKPGAKGERDLQRLESQLAELQEKYDRGKPVFDKLNEWMGLWKEKLNAEQRACRTSFYKNRGGSLNNTLRRQKQLAVQVPKVFHELQALAEAYEQEYNVEDILVEGLRPDKYAEYVSDEYERDKEVQRAQKQFVRQRNDLTPGSTTRRNCASRIASPMLGGGVGMGSRDALRKIKATPSTITKSGRRMSGRKRSMSCSQLSVISPVQTNQAGGPKTSSPKQMQPLDFTAHQTKSPLKPSNATNLMHQQTQQHGLRHNPMHTAGASVYKTPKTSRPWY